MCAHSELERLQWVAAIMSATVAASQGLLGDVSSTLGASRAGTLSSRILHTFFFINMQCPSVLIHLSL